MAGPGRSENRPNRAANPGIVESITIVNYIRYKDLGSKNEFSYGKFMISIKKLGIWIGIRW